MEISKDNLVSPVVCLQVLLGYQKETVLPHNLASSHFKGSPVSFAVQTPRLMLILSTNGCKGL